ncbi:MAG: hypothetical protein KZQ83_18805 [gamma proteobacterium symbiont of Taylorina sp.]|nr:hypothetical protein [gamma proteobacterium symbiont of Taylorina sp.]
MGVIIQKQTKAATSDSFSIGNKGILQVSSGIAINEECVIESYSEIDGWIDTGITIASDKPFIVIDGSCTYRVSKPDSKLAYGIEWVTKTAL